MKKKLSFSFHNNILTDYTLGEKNKIKQIVKTDVIHFFYQHKWFASYGYLNQNIENFLLLEKDWVTCTTLKQLIEYDMWLLLHLVITIGWKSSFRSTETFLNVHWMLTECALKSEFKHCSMTFQWAFSPTECCWMTGTTQWPFSIYFLFWEEIFFKKKWTKKCPWAVSNSGILVLYGNERTCYFYNKRSVSYTHLTLPTICSV